jgi:hypothetical protein
MTPLAIKALGLALAEVGVREEPPGSNRGPRVDEYIRAGGLNPAADWYPWCACFVVWAVREAGAALGIVPRVRRSARVYTLLQRNPESQLDRAEAGAIFVHLKPDTDGHTGLVVAVDEDGSIETVEGNSDAAGSRTGGSVVRQHRPADYVTAYLRIE